MPEALRICQEMIGHRRFRNFYSGCIVSSGPVVRGVRFCLGRRR